MNITFAAAAISDRGRRLLPQIWEEALRLGAEAYGLTNATTEVTDRRAVLNARSVEGTWNAPTWLQDEHGVLSLSQPPVSYTEEIPGAGWEQWARTALREDRGRRTVQPGYFGSSLWKDGGLEVWNDVFGFGRAYVVQNQDFVAAGNHIGMVSLFSSRPLEVDSYGADLLAQVGFWPEDHSTISDVRRLGPAEVVSVGRHDEVSRRRYATDAEFYAYREQEPDFDAVAASMAVLTSNIGDLAVKEPTVHLSGGQDSRVTAAAWLAGGKPAKLQTMGTLQGEVDVAEALLAAIDRDGSLEATGITHRVTYPSPGRISDFSIEDRLASGLLMWDGDFAPGNLKAPIRRPPVRSGLTIGGANGEVMHGIYYSTPKMLEAARAMEHPLDRVGRAFLGKVNTPESRVSTLEFIENQKAFTRSLGHEDATALNVFQMHSKFRRWINAQLTSASFVLLLNPVFVRAGIDLVPEQRLDKVMQKAMSRALIPEWENIPYYKATPEDSKKSVRVQGVRTWQTSPGSMEHLIHERSAWQRWFTPEAMADIETAVHAGEGNAMHESNLNKAYVLDALPDHVSALERVRSRLWGAAA
ncbi:hypothetical protein BH708_10635 [Brachybacterium sp. P6-10-X1]|uniref:hypothetical protein n=1 Tax=Brachybacterium sp. P6-10-X1 TaxID=1903186 RepID=UPI00097179B8|nr:hypothetical protein [Brachybacterium sp. P6-10-X1]APX33093.1 hypothetical protein BH708_10635 [Brachybacterium sp. P6-10-X1]